MKKVLLLSIVLVLLSCYKKNINNATNKVFKGRKTELKVSFSRPQKKEDIKYALWLEKTNATISYSHSHGVLRGKQTPTGYNMTAGFEEAKDVGDIKIGDILLQPKISRRTGGFDYDPHVSAFEEIKDEFGKEVVFKVAEGNEDFEAFEKTLVIPEKFNVSKNLDAFSTKQFHYEVFEGMTTIAEGIDRNGFTINWNADPNNKNGVAVILEWAGITINADELPIKHDAYKRNIELIDDKGSYSFNGFASKNIPPNALVRINIIRGNVEIVKLSTKTVKIAGYSEIIFPTFCLM